MSDYSHTIYVTWVQDGEAQVEEISGTSGLSPGEESDPEDLYSELAESLPGSLYISGELVSTLFFSSPFIYTNNPSFSKLLAGCLTSLR